MKDANCYPTIPYSATWHDIVAWAAALEDGECGLTDGSAEGDWRLPTKEEMQGIGTDPQATWYIDYPSVTWTMPGTPFTNVLTYEGYWTSSTDAPFDHVWYVHLSDGNTQHWTKHGYGPLGWPVRPGH